MTDRTPSPARWWTGALVAAASLLGCPAPTPKAPGASIRVVEVGDRGPEVVAAVVSITGFHPDVAAGLVRRAPVTLPGLTDARAREGARALEALGAKVLVVPAPQAPSDQ